MKNKLRKIYALVVLAVLLAVGVGWIYVSKERDARVAKAYSFLKGACERGQRIGPYTKNADEVCGCFAKSVMRHKSISIASVISDQDMMVAILDDCSRRAKPVKR